MATAADEATYIRPGLYKVFSRTLQGDATLQSPKLNFGTKRRMVIWIRLSAVVGGPPTWTATLNHVRPEAVADPVDAADKIAHATTLARANAGIARQQYGEWAASAALPEIIGDCQVQVVITGGGTATGEVWIELLD